MKVWRRVLRWLAVAVVCVLIGLQFVRPARTNPAVDQSQTIYAHLQVPPQVAAIFDRSCQDCHTNTTRWPWYSNVEPLSWWIVGDVNDGRQQLNLSEWGRYDKRRAGNKLDEICDQVKGGEMPLQSYRLIHRSAKLSPEDVKALCDWTTAERERIAQR
jgi:hypothetical protein